MGTDADTLNSPSKMLRQEVPYCTHPNISGLEANMSQDRARYGGQVSEGILLFSMGAVYYREPHKNDCIVHASNRNLCLKVL